MRRTCALLNLMVIVGLASQLQAQAVRSGFSTVGTQARSDDSFTGPIAIGFPVNFFGTTYSNLYVGTNGYVTFDSGQTGYDPQNLINYQQKVIAPFYGDIDTRSAQSGQITWGSSTVNGRQAFAVTWNAVGYFSSRADKTNTFQLVIINRSDRAANDFDFEFNYNQIQWEAGGVNGGVNGLCSTGCEPPTVGYSNGLSGAANRSFEQPGSHAAGAFLDTNTNTGLKYQQYGGSGLNGRLLFVVSNGTVSGGTPGGGGGSGFCNRTGGTTSGGVSLLDGPICTTAAISANSCVTNRPTGATAFQISDPIVSVWFVLSGLTPSSSLRARFSLNGVEQTALDYGPYSGFQTGFNYYLCPSFIPASGSAGNWTVNVYINNSTTPFMGVSFSVGTSGGGGGSTAPTNSTIFGTSCAGSFPGTWNTNIVGDAVINPVRTDGYLTGGGKFNWTSSSFGNGFVIGRVLNGYTDGGAQWGRWLMAPSGSTMLGAPRGFNSGASVAPSAARSSQSLAAVPCLGTGTAALWIGQWETTPFGLVRGRLNLDGTVTLTLPQNCEFPGGTFTGVASGLGLTGTYAGPGGSGGFTVSFGSSDITNFSGTFSIGASGTQTFSGSTKEGAINSDFQSNRGFQGRWYTPYGLLTLKVTGSNVTGTYPNGGTITGTVSQGGTFSPPSFGAGITLTGTYSDSSSSGNIILQLNGVASPPDAFPGGGSSHFFGTSANSSGLTAPWTGARAGDWSGTWNSELGTMTIAQRGDGKWVGRVGGYTFVGNTTNPKAGGNAWSGQWIGPFGGGGFSSTLNPDGVSFSLSVAGWSHLGYYGTLNATHTSDTIGTLDLCSTINPVTTITTVPAGLQVQVDSTTITAPTTRSWTPGQYHGFGTTTPQTLSGVQYNFSLWNYTRGLGGGILAPPSSTTYTAVFTTTNAGAGPGGLGGFWDSPIGQIWVIPGPGNTVNGVFPGGGPSGFSGFTCTVSGNTCTGTAFTPNGTPGTITITITGPSLSGTVTRPGGGGNIPFTGTLRGPATGPPTTPEVNNGPVMTSAHQSTCSAALPSPIRPSFYTNDPNITHWVSLIGVPVGGTIEVAYTSPTGARFAGQTISNWADVWVCYTLPVSPATATQGQWTVALSVNGQTISQARSQFTLSAAVDNAAGGGGGGPGTGTPVSGQNPGSAGTGGTGGGGNSGGGGTNLLCNGSFEQPGGSHIFNIIAGNTIIPCWTVVKETIDYLTPTFSNFTGSDGLGFIDLDGSAPGAISQTFTTTPNTQYTASFDLAGTPGYGATVKQLQVTAAGQSINRTFDQTGKSPTAMGWEHHTFTFTSGAGTTTTLQFTSTGPAPSNGGPTIDNVCVIQGSSPCGSGTGGGGGSGTSGTTILSFDINGLGNGALMPQGYGDNVTAPIMGTYSYGGQANTPDVTVEYRRGLTGAGGDPHWWAAGFGDLRNVLYNENDGETGFRAIFSAPAGVTLTINSFDMGNFGGAATVPAVRVIDGNGTAVLNRTNVALPASTGGHITLTGPWTGPSPLTLLIDTTGLSGDSDNIAVDNISFSQNGGSGGGGTGGGTGGGGTDGGAGNPPATTSGTGCSYNVDKIDVGGVAGLRNQPAAGVSLDFGFVRAGTGCKFAAYSPVSWVKVTPLVLTDIVGGQGTWTYQIEANTGPERRTILTVAGQQATVIQLAGASSCQYSLVSSSSLAHPATASTGSATVNVTGAACTLTAAIDPAVPIGQQFAQLTSSTTVGGPGTKTFNYSVSPNNTTSARNIRLVLTGTNPTATLNFTINQVAGTANTNPAPGINPSGGITNSASFIPGGPIAQGSFFSIFGTNMGPPNPGMRATAYPLQTSLGNVSVAVTGGGRTVQALPVFVAEFQVNAIMPSNAPTGAVTVTVTYNGVAGPPQNSTVVGSAFGAFAVAAGRGPGIVQNALADGTRPLNSPITSTSRGSYVILWGTGLGPLASSLGCGAAIADQCSPDTSYRPQVNSIQVFVGGVAANMQDQYAYAARAPGIAGVDQVQFPIPPNAPLGCYVPLQVVVNGTLYSNAVTLAIGSGGSSCPEDYPVSSFPRSGGKNAVVTLTRVTVNDPANPTLNGLLDLARGSFIQQPAGGPLGFDVFSSSPPLGTCTYYNNINLDGLVGGRAPAIPGATNLDAGALLTIRGPRGTQTVPYQDVATAAGPYLKLLAASGALSGIAGQTDFLNPGSYTVSGAGGQGVGTFSFDITLGSVATLLNPPTVIDRSRSLTVNWSGGNSATQEIFLAGYSSDTARNATGLFLCRVPIGSGSFTVPAGMIANLPAAAGQLVFFAVPQASQLPSFTSSNPALDHGTATYQLGTVTGVTFQ